MTTDMRANDLTQSWKSRFWLCVLIAVFASIVPVARACFGIEVSYNEGWNVYAADAVVHRQLLYPVRYGWTSVNYPMLSFWLMAELHRITHEYLFTARLVSILSLVLCAVLVGAIVRSLGARRSSATLAGLFCWAVFCADANGYVGMDDPQLLAQAVLLAGLWIYVRWPRGPVQIAATALALAIGLFIKHNAVEFPLAVLLDLSFVSIPLAFWFLFCDLSFVAIGMELTIHFGGPFFLDQLLSPRGFSFAQIPLKTLIVLGPVCLPLVGAVYTAWQQRNNARRRVFSILLVTSLLLGMYFSGGVGVSVNALFGVLVSIALLLGFAFDQNDRGRILGRWQRFAAMFPARCFLWLGIPLLLSGNWNPVARLKQAATAQSRFRQDVALLRAHPGRALCENLLECYSAGKPYLYDPFNATRLIRLHKLDARVVVAALQDHRFAMVETEVPIEREDKSTTERFDPRIASAIAAFYVPAPGYPRADAGDLDGDEDVVLYVPR